MPDANRPIALRLEPIVARRAKGKKILFFVCVSQWMSFSYDALWFVASVVVFTPNHAPESQKFQRIWASETPASPVSLSHPAREFELLALLTILRAALLSCNPPSHSKVLKHRYMLLYHLL